MVRISGTQKGRACSTEMTWVLCSPEPSAGPVSCWESQQTVRRHLQSVLSVLGTLLRSEITLVFVNVCLFTSHCADPYHLQIHLRLSHASSILRSAAGPVLILEPEQHCCQALAGAGTYFYCGDVLLGTSNDVWKPDQ